jgi:hypothetical protein
MSAALDRSQTGLPIQSQPASRRLADERSLLLSPRCGRSSTSSFHSGLASRAGRRTSSGGPLRRALSTELAPPNKLNQPHARHSNHQPRVRRGSGASGLTTWRVGQTLVAIRGLGTGECAPNIKQLKFLDRVEPAVDTSRLLRKMYKFFDATWGKDSPANVTLAPNIRPLAKASAA